MSNEKPSDDSGAEHTKWWETPGAGHTGPTTPPSDATMVNPNAQYPSAPQPYPNDPQYAAGQQPYPSGQQYPSGGQPYPGGQQYASGAQQYAAPGAGGPGWPPGQPPPGPGFPGYPGSPGAPSRSKNTTVFIVLGVVLVVVVLLCGGGGIALLNAGGDTEEDKEWAGDYTMDSVTNACDLVDATVLDTWASTNEDTTHRENEPSESYGGGSLSCRINNEGANSDSASLTLDVAFDGEFTSYGYEDWKKSDTATTGSEYNSGAVTGLGEQGYFASHAMDYSSFDTLDYSVAATDSNVSVKVNLNITADGTINQTQVDQICRNQVEKVMDSLRK